MGSRKLKVYGWNDDGTHRLVVAASSWKEACALANETDGWRRSASNMREYGCVTGNLEELQTCLADPRVVYFRKSSGRELLRPLTKEALRG